ncbi:SAP domain-containing protein [Enterococcus casseliflavus]|nr:SAP domain-containing protein [Enterococcus casseliflavus]
MFQLFPGYFEYEYGIKNPKKQLEQFISNGLLRRKSPLDSLDKMSIPEIKQILVSYDTATTGKKVDLIKRIKNELSEVQATPFITKIMYEVTDEGNVILYKYKNVILTHENNFHKSNSISWEMLTPKGMMKHLEVEPFSFAVEVSKKKFFHFLMNIILV